MIEKRLSVWRSEYDYNTKKIQGGPVQANLGGGQSRDIFRGGPVKKTTLYLLNSSSSNHVDFTPSASGLVSDPAHLRSQLLVVDGNLKYWYF